MEKYLVHHGILGQKWGKKNGPPYPLHESDHSALEKKMNGEGNNKIKTQGEARKYKLTAEQKDKVLKIAKTGAKATAAALAIYGGYKLGKINPSILKKGMKFTGKLVKESGKGFVDGLPEGARGAGKTLGKAFTGGITWMAGIEIMDLYTNGAATDVILKAYNDHNKKNRVGTSYRNKNKKTDEEED